jgi:GNAT superfamily N-acetyltransferase
MPSQNFCWTDQEQDVTVLVADDRESKTVMVTLFLPKPSYCLSIFRAPSLGYYLEDITGADKIVFSKGARRRGIGTLLMNTAIEYLRSLPSDDHATRRLEGRMVPHLSEPPQQQVER